MRVLLRFDAARAAHSACAPWTTIRELARKLPLFGRKDLRDLQLQFDAGCEEPGLGFDDRGSQPRE